MGYKALSSPQSHLIFTTTFFLMRKMRKQNLKKEKSFPDHPINKY